MLGIFSQYGAGNADHFLQVYYHGANDAIQMTWFNHRLHTRFAVTSSGGVSKGEWIFISGSINGEDNISTSCKIYLNGVEAAYASQSQTNSGFTDGNAFSNLGGQNHIGTSDTGSGLLDGTADTISLIVGRELDDAGHMALFLASGGGAGGPVGTPRGLSPRGSALRGGRRA